MKRIEKNNTQYIIYHENGKFKMTDVKNFNARVRNARIITTFNDFTNIDDVVKYIQRYF